jgi:hypothetical protein
MAGPAGEPRAGRRSTACAAAACRRSTRRRTRSWPASKTCRSSAAWSTCSTSRWTRHRPQPQALPAHEQRGADDGHHRRVPGPDAGHLARRAGRLRPAQPPAGRRGHTPRASSSARSCPSGAATKRATAFLVSATSASAPTRAWRRSRRSSRRSCPGMARSRPATARRSTTARRRCLVMSEAKAKSLGSSRWCACGRRRWPASTRA